MGPTVVDTSAGRGGSHRGRPAAVSDRPPTSAVQALVVFVGAVELPWLTVLRPGFRHCFVVVRRGDHWVICDPLSTHTVLDVVSGLGVEDLAGWYRGRGLTVVETAVRPAPGHPAPWRPYTCVEAVKRVLAIGAPAVLTPWQLFRYLREEEKKP